jgi:arsenate reductase
MVTRPSVLFVCVHNAGRSQMAAGFLTHLAGDAIEVRSAGSAPAASINPAAVAAMAEVGIDIAAQSPKILTPDAVETSDVVITMGCGDECPRVRANRREDWQIPDPRDMTPEQFRGVRDLIERKVKDLLAVLEAAAGDRSPQSL